MNQGYEKKTLKTYLIIRRENELENDEQSD
jgi:hypothetical protein